QGIPPYAGAYNFKMPGIYVVYAAILAALGQTPTAIHVGLLIANAIAIVLMFLVGRRLIGTLGGVVAGAAYATLTLSPRLRSSPAPSAPSGSGPLHTRTTTGRASRSRKA